jgi:apolipoprotein N-acyltransferase
VALYLSYEETVKPVSVVVVQPNIDPYNEKFTSMTSAQQMHKILGLAKTKITDSTQYVLLPETAIPNGEWEELLSESANIDSLSTLFNAHPKTKIISGLSSYAEVFPKNQNDLPVSFRKDDQGWYESYNAAVQIDTTFNFQIYHKSLLVIGAEKMPFANLLKPLSSLIIDFGGTTGSLGVQSERSLLYAPDSSMAIAPIICYESIYSDYVADYVQKGAQLLFIMTNDGWWDNSPGYQQHFAFARLRAIENRRSIARSANTGISGFINQRGDIVDASEFWTDAALSTTLNANTELSVFSRFPRFLGTLACITASVLLLTTLILFFKGKAV